MGKGKKVALLVGVGRYGEGLKPLQCPANGVTALQTVLETPEIGGFDEVIPLVDPDVGTMRSRMGEVFNRLTKHDLVLFYFTGHGIKDMTGAFYLTTAQTQIFKDHRLNPGTAIEASFVKSLIGNCYAQRKVVVLDCCFGAAFADGFLTMDDGGVDVQADLGGEGYVVLTAATARNYALEQEGEPLSVYTRYLVEGLKTGAAAPEGKSHISVIDLHHYIYRKVRAIEPRMTPGIVNTQQGEAIWLVKAFMREQELKYRQEINARIRRGEIKPAGRAILNIRREQLQICLERAQEIETEILKPFQEKQRKLDIFEFTLREELTDFPLRMDALREIKDLCKILDLSKNEIVHVSHMVLQEISSDEDFIEDVIDKIVESEYESEKNLESTSNEVDFNFIDLQRESTESQLEKADLISAGIFWEDLQGFWGEVIGNIKEFEIKVFLVNQTSLLEASGNHVRIGVLSKESLEKVSGFEKILCKAAFDVIGSKLVFEFNLSDQPPIRKNLVDLEILWDDILKDIQPLGTRALLSQQGCLMSYDGENARIGVRSKPLLKMSQGRIHNIEQAFEKSLHVPAKIKIEFSDLISPNEIETEVWKLVSDKIEPLGTRALMQQQANLVSFDGNKAKFIIRSKPLFKMACGRISNLESAFKAVLNYPVSVELVAVNLEPICDSP